MHTDEIIKIPTQFEFNKMMVITKNIIMYKIIDLDEKYWKKYNRQRMYIEIHLSGGVIISKEYIDTHPKSYERHNYCMVRNILENL